MSKRRKPKRYHWPLPDEPGARLKVLEARADRRRSRAAYGLLSGLMHDQDEATLEGLGWHRVRPGDA